MGSAEIERFLNRLAVNRKVGAATQNLALCAIVFMYKRVLILNAILYQTSTLIKYVIC